MKMWLIGGMLVGLLSVSFYLAAAKRSGPAAAIPGESVVVAVEARPILAPVVFTQVVDVTDIEPLLDPPGIPLAEAAASGPMLTRVGYEEVVPTEQPSVDVKPIPKATEEGGARAEEEIAKTDAVRRASRLFSAASQVPASRLEWYTRCSGSSQFPKQVGHVISPEDHWDQLPNSRVLGYFF